MGQAKKLTTKQAAAERRAQAKHTATIKKRLLAYLSRCPIPAYKEPT